MRIFCQCGAELSIFKVDGDYDPHVELCTDCWDAAKTEGHEEGHKQGYEEGLRDAEAE